MLREDVLYPRHYLLFVVLATGDVFVTWVILMAGGYEANLMAERLLEQWGMPGLVGLKFLSLALVVCICEFIGRRRAGTGRRLAEWAVAINCIPVTVGLTQLGLRAAGMI